MLPNIPTEIVIANVLPLLSQSDILNLAVVSKPLKEVAYYRLYSNIYVLLSLLEDHTEFSISPTHFNNVVTSVGYITKITDALKFSHFTLHLSKELKSFIKLIKMDVLVFGSDHLELFVENDPLRCMVMTQKFHLNQFNCSILYQRHITERLKSFHICGNSLRDQVDDFTKKFDLDTEFPIDKFEVISSLTIHYSSNGFPIKAVLREMKLVRDWQIEYEKLQVESTYFNII